MSEADEKRGLRDDEQSVGIGELLVTEGFLTKDRLERARRIQSKMEVRERLSSILVRLEYIYESQIREVMRKHKRRLRLGDFLIEMKVITEADLQRILKIQKKERKRLGKLLLEQGAISELDLCRALSEQLDAPVLHPDMRAIDLSLTRGLSIKFLRKQRAIPFTSSSEGVVVIMADPLDKEAVQAVSRALNAKALPAISTEENIMNALEHLENRQALDRVETSEKPGEKSSIIQIVDAIIVNAIEEGVSDIHVETLSKKVRVRFRKDGVLIHKSDYPKQMQEPILTRIKVLAGADITNKLRHQDGKIVYEYYNHEIDIRFSSYVSIHGETIVLRILSKLRGFMNLDELGMAPKMVERYIAEGLEPTSGIVIVTGPTGSGKTTTLYSSIDFCNDPSLKIITAEDPVEFAIDGIVQCSVKPQYGLTFEDTLKSIVRQDPDIVVLGEIRDRITAEFAIQVALTGHKVFSTFHTEDSIGGIIRLIDMEIETFLISSTVLSIVAQRLLRKICEFCKEAYTPDPLELKRVGLSPEMIGGYQFFRGAGCEHCHHTGYSGRVGIYELLVLNEDLRDAVLAKKTSFEIRRIGIEGTGLATLLEDGLRKAVKGVTTIEQLRKHLPYTSPPRDLDTIMSLSER